MKDALAIHRMLLERQTVHEIVRLPRPITCADDLPTVLGLPPCRCLCTRLYAPERHTRARASGRHHLIAVIVTAGVSPRPATIAQTLGLVGVRPAPADMINEDTGYAAELVAPLLLPTAVTTLVDQAAACLDDVVYTCTGEPCTALGIHTLDLFALCSAKPAPVSYVFGN